MPTLLVRNADILVTMDGARREIPGGALLARDGVIEAVGAEIPPEAASAADRVIDASGCVVTPGLVNTHHHMFQTLVRSVPGGQDALLFGWLKSLYPLFARMGPEEFRISARLALAELALSGCSMSSDHQYLYVNGARLDDAIEGAEPVGLRFHPTRGAMTLGESQGGLPPDAICEREPAVMEEMIRLVDTFHDPRPGAMLRIGLSPCSPFTVTQELFRDTALLARDKGVRLHTHLAENDEDIAFCREKLGCRPGQYMEEAGWLGEDVWHAHCVKLDGAEIDRFAATGTGVAHCPCSNCRLGSGIAPVRAMRDAGVTVALGVDGSASSDSGDLISSARQALLLQRVANGADAMPAREALEIATLGGAKALGRDDLGSLEPGKRCDLAIWDVSGIETIGAWDMTAALILTGPHRVRDLIVEGRDVVRDKQLVTIDLGKALEEGRRAVARLAS